MKQEQRMLVAFVLIAGILAIWSALMPPQELPIHRPPEIATEKKPALLVGKPGDSTKDFELGRFVFGIGENRGGLSTLKIDREPLFEKAAPGLLEIRVGQPNPEPIRFQSSAESGKLISGGIAGDGIEIQREIQSSSDNPYRLQCLLRATNRSRQPKPIQLQLVIYRPLYSSDPAHKEAGGSMLLAGKEMAISVKRGQVREFPGTPEWVASYGKSHAAIVQIPGKEGMFHVEHLAGSDPVGVLQLPKREIPAEGTVEWEFPLYVGPMSLGALQGAGLEKALTFGAFSGVARGLLAFLDWSYKLFKNYGLAICLLSIAVWLPFSPLTWYARRLSLRTMKRMAEIKPQESRIRQEHKGKPDQMQRELMQLYKKRGVNPASGCIGCLPLLFTWPIYIALFQVLTRAPELRGADFLWIRDLAAPDGMIPLPFEMPLIGNRLNVLPILATIATYFQQAMMQPPAMEMSAEQKAQQNMMKFFPVIFMVMFYQLPSGFMLYWVVNSTLTVAQQLATDRLEKARA